MVLRVSFFTLFNLQGTRRFAAGLYFTTFRGICQALFQPFSKFSEALGLFASRANFYILPDLQALVKNFFQGFDFS